MFRRDGDASFRVPTYLKEWPFRNDAGPVCRRDPLTIAPRMPADLIPNVHTFPCMATPATGPALPAGEGALVLVDPFLRLPLELRMLVAVGLTTTCVKDLRLSSRAFCFLFHSNQFWAFRFLDPRQERAWFPVSSSLESPLLKSVAAGSRDQAREEVRPALTWRTLYWLTGVERMPEQWQNRRRVWKLARGLKMLFGMQQVSFCFWSTVVPSRSLIGSNLPLTPLTNSPSGNQSRTHAFVSRNDGAMERNKTSSP